jgi:hypothetical protein
MKLRTHPYLVAMALLASCLTLRAQVQISLPPPIVRETFESVEEGKLPAGWSVTNYTDAATGIEDLDDPRSDSFLNWVVITRDRLAAITGGGFNPAHRLAIAPNQFVNGVAVTNLADGKFIYAESDVRGGSQVQYLYSPDFNLAGKSNVFVSYYSMYTQNQDNINSLEYSIDEGKTWLPIIYMIDVADIIRAADGSIDAVATLSAARGDAAHYIDPLTGEDIGRTYGAFIGVATNRWSTLAPFISGRINDDNIESKRVELFRLPQADNQAKVRFRFAQAGTASWYWGIDNFGLYSITQSKPGRPTIAGAASVSFFGDAAFTGSSFQSTAAGQTHGLSVWQISASSSFSTNNGFASVVESYTSSKSLTSLNVRLGHIIPGVTYYATVQYKDQSGAGSDFAAPISFTVSGALPQPLFFENFESTPEGTVPTGWTVDNQTDGGGVGEDPANFRSDTYLNWTVTTFENLQTFGGDRVNDTNVVSGKSIYANSDSRTGDQIQFLTTPDINLAGKSNVWLVFKSNYKQNQDSFAGIEYSIDGGTNWLSITYMIDTADVLLKADGSIDATKTLTTTYGDVAKLIDPATGAKVAAGKYADFILAKPIDSLGPFINGRTQDEDFDSKRVERFRLTSADNQSKVRIRFTQAGTDSWFWGVDDLGLYSIGTTTTPPRTKPDAPQIALPSSLTLFDATLTFTGSAFAGILPADVNAQTILQISPFSGFTAGAGFTNVLLSITNSAGATAVAASSARLFPGQTYYLTMQYQDKNGVKSDFSTPVSFAVSSLPAPIALETFESTPDYGLPTGWTVTNQTDTVTAGINTTNRRSDNYKDWLVVPAATLALFSADRPVASVVDGKSIYAESDDRTGNQIQVLFSPEYNLSGRNNIWVAFKSNYVQNQDSIGVMEYTVDGGATWLPLIYMIDDKTTGGDVVRTNGAINAVATLTTTAGDIAKIIDPATGARVAAGKYADFILAKPIDSLAPYISGRIDDDKAESRRYERFRLTAADNQAKVRFRFVYAGTASWWWGIDDFGIYSLGSSANVQITRIAASGPGLTISWSGGSAPYLVQMKNSLSDANWMNVLTTSAQSATVARLGTAGFYRVVGGATNTVIPFTAALTGDAERPNPVTTSASGIGMFSLEGNTLNYNISYSNLSSAPTASHIHGPAASTAAAAVLKAFVTPTGTSGAYSGSVTLSDAEKALLLSGQTYANLHTTANGGGEIRGQIGLVNWKVSLNGTAERPTPVTTTATGSGTLTLIGNQLSYNISYSGLSSAATQGHIHGPASTAVAAGVLQAFVGVTGTSGTLTGTLTLKTSELGALIDGLTYANIHTGTNAGGEIRGQITP